MNFQISDIKVNELARIAEVKPPIISRKYKDLEPPRITIKNKRISGISPEEIEMYFRNKNFGHIYKTTIILSNSTVGGTGKTSSVNGLTGALRRITNRTKPVIVIDGDSQASCTTTLIGDPIADNKPVLVDYMEGRATLDDILSEVNDNNLYVIGSNLNNIYLDKALNGPKMLKSGMEKLLSEILVRFPAGTRIIIDTPPQLSNFTASCICGISQISMNRDIISRYIIPLRPDSYALKGAKISYREKADILETFSLPDIETSVFLTAFHKRMNLGMEIMRQLLQDDDLQNCVNPVVVRHSTEIPKSNANGSSIFSEGKVNTATTDYMDLCLEILGYKSDTKGHA